MEVGAELKKIILIVLLTLVTFNQAISANSNQKLVCQGWTYIRDNNGVLLNPNINNESGKYFQLIDIDVTNMKISTRTDYGEIKATLITSDEAYYGDYTPNIKIGNTKIDNIRIYVNRYTGGGSIFADTSDKIGGLTIFNGECKPQQKRF